MDKFAQITSNAEEIVTVEELKSVLNKPKPKGRVI